MRKAQRVQIQAMTLMGLSLGNKLQQYTRGRVKRTRKRNLKVCFVFFDTGPLTYLQAWNKDSPHVIFSFFFLYLLNNGSSSHLDVLEVKTRTRSDSG